MKPEIQINDFRPEDTERFLVAIRHLQTFLTPLFDRMKPVEEIGTWYIDALLEWCSKYKGRIRLAEKNGEIVGYSVVVTSVPSDEDEIDEVLYTYGVVAELLVREEFRGQGLGRLLLEDCEKIAREAGVKWLRINTLAKNTNARRVYESFGFRDHLITLEKPLASA